MMLLQIAGLVMVAALFMYYSARAMGLLLFLFIYQTLKLAIPFETIYAHFHFVKHWHYFAAFFVLAGAITGAVFRATRKAAFLRFALFGALACLTLSAAPLSDVLLFKSDLQALGMWGADYWKGQISELASSSPDKKQNALEKGWSDFASFVANIWRSAKKS